MTICISNSHSQKEERDIRNLFTEIEPGIFYFTNPKDPEHRPYQYEGQTVEEFIWKKIHPVVKDFLKTNYDGNAKELAKYIGNKSLKQFSEHCSRNKIILSKENQSMSSMKNIFSEYGYHLTLRKKTMMKQVILKANLDGKKSKTDLLLQCTTWEKTTTRKLVTTLNSISNPTNMRC